MNPKIGDIIHVRMRVASTGRIQYGAVYARQINVEGLENSGTAVLVGPGRIIKIEERPLQVGDDVSVIGMTMKNSYKILALDKTHAWVKDCISDVYHSISLRSLERYDG